MEFKLIKTDRESLDNIPINNGNFIVLKDEDGIYYDMEGIRHPMKEGAIGEWYQYDSSIGEWETVEKVNEVSGRGAHVEGTGNVASGEGAHAEGATGSNAVGSNRQGNYATGIGSHAEGIHTTSSGQGSHSEGHSTNALSEGAHAEGVGTTASGQGSHAEGRYAQFSQYEGPTYTTASGTASHAGGAGTVVSGNFAFGHGYGVVANSDDVIVFGRFPNETQYTNKVFVVGNGAAKTSRSDAFYVDALGTLHAVSTSISGIDYAEYFYPWYDGNENDEDRCGYFVTVKNGQLYKASTEDIVIGITSQTYGVLGTPDALHEWKGRWQKDEFGRFLLDENGQKIESEEYDPQQPYLSREERDEWSAVGILGQLIVRDDGTCVEGQFCKTTDDGIATLSQDNSGYLVLERTGENTVKVLFK